MRIFLRKLNNTADVPGTVSTPLQCPRCTVYLHHEVYQSSLGNAAPCHFQQNISYVEEKSCGLILYRAVICLLVGSEENVDIVQQQVRGSAPWEFPRPFLLLGWTEYGLEMGCSSV